MTKVQRRLQLSCFAGVRRAMVACGPLVFASACTVPNDQASEVESGETVAETDPSADASQTQSSTGTSEADAAEEGSDDTSESESGDTVPAAPTLELELEPIKTFAFSWAPVQGAESYSLYEAIDASASFELLVEDLETTSVRLEVPLYRRAGARYRLEACNVHGCTESDDLFVDGTLAAAVGAFKYAVPDADDAFGNALALSADGLTLAVGVPGEDSQSSQAPFSERDNSQLNAGAVYIYQKGTRGWELDALLKAPQPAPTANWGTSLALSGDGLTLAVGSPADASGAGYPATDPTDITVPFSGAVHVFDRVEGAWVYDAYIKARVPEAQDNFGASIALSHDGAVLAIGAPGEDSANELGVVDPTNNDAPEAGAVSVYARVADSWADVAFLKAPGANADERFGEAIALSPQGDRLAVGAPGDASASNLEQADPDDDSAPEAGAVHLFDHVTLAWEWSTYLKPTNTHAGAQFGASLAMVGEASQIVIGAPGERRGGSGAAASPSEALTSPDSGAVYSLLYDGDVWVQDGYFKAITAAQGDRFGSSVSVSADGLVIVAGAVGQASELPALQDELIGMGMPAAGAVFSYVFDGRTWQDNKSVKAPSPGANHRFGTSLRLDPDGALMVVGAPGEAGSAGGISPRVGDQDAPGAGAVYLF